MGNRWVSWVELKACGSKGGIIIMWNRRTWQCVDTQARAYLISCKFESLAEDFKWVFIGVYGPHTNSERNVLWLELASIKGLWSDNWVIGGDFNVCRYETERLNCTRRSRAMKNFSDLISNLELIDLPL